MNKNELINENILSMEGITEAAFSTILQFYNLIISTIAHNKNPYNLYKQG
jgi:hypothetical protein